MIWGQVMTFNCLKKTRLARLQAGETDRYCESVAYTMGSCVIERQRPSSERFGEGSPTGDLSPLSPDPTTLDIRGTIHPRGKRSLLGLGSSRCRAIR